MATAKVTAEPAPAPLPPRKTPAETKQVSDDFSEKTPLPSPLPDTDAGSYFAPDETEEASESGVIPPPTSAAKIPAAAKPILPAAPKKEEEPGSIYDILEEIPLSIDPAPSDRHVSSFTPTHVSAKIPEAAAPTGEVAYKLTLIEGEGEVEPFEITIKESVSIGRSPSNDVVLKAAKVSRQHAAINRYKDQYIIIDLKSSNGVYINGKKTEEQSLQDGDEVSIGGYKMLFQKA